MYTQAQLATNLVLMSSHRLDLPELTAPNTATRMARINPKKSGGYSRNLLFDAIFISNVFLLLSTQQFYDKATIFAHFYDPYRNEAQRISDIRPVGERLGVLLEHSESGRGQYLIGTRQHSLDHRPREHHTPLLIRGDLDLGVATWVPPLLAVDERSPHRQLEIDRPRPALRRQVIVRRGLLVPEQVSG